jgi:hypothetical protein
MLLCMYDDITEKLHLKDTAADKIHSEKEII